MQPLFKNSSSIILLPSLILSFALALTLLFNHTLFHLSSLLFFSVAAAVAACLLSRPLPVFFLNYSCHHPDPEHRCTLELCEYIGMCSRQYSPESAEFMRTIYHKSGLGDETYAPPYVFQPNFDAKFTYAIVEADDGMFSTVSSLLLKSSVPAEKITVLIVACSMFSPAPSLSSRLVNRFGLRSDIKTFNLSGMGCSAGTVGMDLAARILGLTQGYALLVVTEAIGLNWYYGDNRHMLVTNCIFRVGTAATLLTSDPAARHSSKFELLHTLRTHHGADDDAYNAATQADDDKGSIGVSLTKDLVRVAGVSLREHIAVLAPRVLPTTELLSYAWRVLICAAKGEKKKTSKPVPDFTKAFEHMCIHAGGKAVIDAVGRILGLDDRITEPARMCLHRFGNTSSSLVFYELGYFEAKGRVRRGDRVWMLAFGTGFKACSVVWRALRDGAMEPGSPWKDCVHRYPI